MNGLLRPPHVHRPGPNRTRVRRSYLTARPEDDSGAWIFLALGGAVLILLALSATHG